MPKSNHSKISEKVIGGVLLGALVGGAAVTLIASKKGKRLQSDVTHKYHEIRDNISDFLCTIEKNISKKMGKQVDGWVDKAKDNLEYIKDQVSSLDPGEYKELGIGLALGTLMGALLGVGATAYLHNRSNSSNEGILHQLGSQVSSWKPIIFELQNLMNEKSGVRPREHLDHQPLGKMNDALELAAAGLKMWNNLKK